MMKVRMLQTQMGADDDREVREYQAGKEYDLGVELATVFVVELGCAELVDEKPAPAAPKPEKAAAPAPKRQAAQKAPQRRKKA